MSKIPPKKSQKHQKIQKKPKKFKKTKNDRKKILKSKMLKKSFCRILISFFGLFWIPNIPQKQ